MVLDKCIVTIVYVSKCPDFLKIDQESLLQYFYAEIARLSSRFDRSEFAPILEIMLGAGYYPEVSSILGRMIESGKLKRGMQLQFLSEIQMRYPYTSAAVKKCQAGQKTEPQTSIREQAVQNTPLFGIRPRNSTFQHSEVTEK